ncbi:ATP-dependent DNA helicase PIF1-like protein [Tanacetum coccineum]
MLSLLIGDEKEYESSDSVCLADDDSNFDDSIYTTEFLNGIRMSGIPHHSIKLKIGTPIMLMCNIDQRAGLCNGTRLQVLRMGDNIIKAKIIFGGSVGTICAIPHMIISLADTKMPFKLNRCQFPIQVCFAMTINKSQGQTLSQVGLFLRRHVFSYGQLYVAVSRVKNKKGLKVLCSDKDGSFYLTKVDIKYVIKGVAKNEREESYVPKTDYVLHDVDKNIEHHVLDKSSAINDQLVHLQIWLPMKSVAWKLQLSIDICALVMLACNYKHTGVQQQVAPTVYASALLRATFFLKRNWISLCNDYKDTTLANTNDEAGLNPILRHMIITQVDIPWTFPDMVQ